jgi:hypothetical protein
VSINIVIPLLAVATSVACMVLLFYAYAVRGARLLYWSALFFLCLTVNSVLLFFSIGLAIPDVDWRLYRFGSSAAGLVFLLYGLIYEAR